jgi:hypothetical protein
MTDDRVRAFREQTSPEEVALSGRVSNQIDKPAEAVRAERARSGAERRNEVTDDRVRAFREQTSPEAASLRTVVRPV